VVRQRPRVRGNPACRVCGHRSSPAVASQAKLVALRSVVRRPCRRLERAYRLHAGVAISHTVCRRHVSRSHRCSQRSGVPERFGSLSTAFGANLLGAMVGGLLEYASLAIGYRNLIPVVAVLYAFAFALGFRMGRRPDSDAAVPSPAYSGSSSCRSLGVTTEHGPP
jgi:hypothetical protein